MKARQVEKSLLNSKPGKLLKFEIGEVRLHQFLS
jgi:hypothetical protein